MLGGGKYMEKNGSREEGWRGQEKVTIFNRIVKESITEKVTLKRRT